MRALLDVLIVALLGGLAEAALRAHGTSGAALVNAAHTKGAQGAAGRNAEEVAACSCDCCMAIKGEQASRGPVGGHICSPRAIASKGSSDGGCQPVCRSTEDGSASAFQAKSDQVDYARYCLAACSPADDEVDVLCMANSVISGNISASGRPELAAAAVESHVAEGGSEASSEEQDPPVNAAALILAKGEMMAAKKHAEAAGAGARAAREAYEAIVASADSMGTAAAKATVDAMRKEAGKQAKRALQVRQNWEDGVKKSAFKAAIGAAITYRDAKARDMLLAGAWSERAGQFDSAASSEEQIATQDSALAMQYHNTKETALAKDYAVKARGAIDAANEYAKRAAAARSQAGAIRQGAMWYDYAARAAAQNVIAASIPPGVVPPMLPPLP